MSPLQFNFGNAVTHFRKTAGPRGFLIKFVAVFLLVQLGLQGVGIFFNLPVYALYLEMFSNSVPPEELADRLSEASNKSGIVSLLVTPLSLLAWMAFEGCSQRRYMRGEGFRLRLGNDEWRLLVVGLLWLAIIFAIYIVFALFVGIPLLIGAVMQSSSGMLVAGIISGVMALIGIVGVLYIVTRLSAAAALTVRDEKIQFFESWKLTKGRVGTLMGANFVLWIVSILGVMVFYGVMIGLVVWHFQPGFNGILNIRALAAQPAFWVPVAGLCLVWLAFMALMQHVMGGPAALVAKDDPNWIGNGGIAQSFD